MNTKQLRNEMHRIVQDPNTSPLEKSLASMVLSMKQLRESVSNQKFVQALKVKDVASRLDISESSVLKLIDGKHIHAVNVSPGSKRPTWRIPVESYEAFLNAPQEPKKPARRFPIPKTQIARFG